MAEDDQTLIDDLRQLVDPLNQPLQDCQLHFYFQLFKTNKNLEYQKFYFLYRLVLFLVNTTFSKQELIDIVVSKINVLGRQHPNFEYDYTKFSSDSDDVNYKQTVSGHRELRMKDVALANECYNQIPNLSKMDDASEQKKDTKKQAKHYAMLLTKLEQQQILRYVMRIIQNLTLYRTTFDDRFQRDTIFGTEIVSEIHYPFVKQLEPLSQSFLFKEKSEMELMVLKELKPKANQLYKDVLAQVEAEKLEKAQKSGKIKSSE